MNDNSKIIKDHKNKNYLLEAQVFIGGVNVD